MAALRGQLWLMRFRLACLAAIALAACQTAAESALFDPASLKAGGDDETTTLTGWLSVTGESGLVLYPTHATLAAKARPGCIFVRPTSMAGIITPEYNGKQMTVQGQLTAEASAGCPMTLTASDISVP